MVQQNELRLGNYVFNVGDYVEITSIDWTGINRSLYDKFTGTDNYYCTFPGPIGIPLTPEVLEKSGFKYLERYADDIVYKCGELEIPVDVDDHPKTLLLDFVTIKQLRNNQVNTIYLEPVKYLHQLQNFYFAFTGQELKIRL